MKKLKMFESKVFESNMFIADEVAGEITGRNFKYTEGEKENQNSKEKIDLKKNIEGFRKDYSELSDKWHKEYEKIMNGKQWNEATPEQRKQVNRINAKKNDYEEELYKKWNVTFKDITSN